MEPSDNALDPNFAQLVRELADARGQLAACAASNNRLNSELEARTRELTASSDVLKVMSRSAFDLQTVLNTLTESAARLCGADTAIIRRREGDAYPVAATYGLTKKQRDHFAIYPTSPSRESVFGRAVMECRTIHVPDVLADPEYNRPQLQDFVAVRAMLGVPLIRDGVPVGVFTLQRRDPQPYTQQQIDLVTTFADQALIAIENVRLFQEVQARTAEAQESLEYQTATADVLNVISRAPSQLQPVFESIVETAARLCEADSATVFQLADDRRYHLTASHGYSPEYRELLRRRPLSPGRETAIGRMAVECRTIQIEDTLCDPDYMFHEAQKLGGYRSILAVPLLRDGKAIAAIALGRSAVRPFSAKQIQLVETFADQAVIAINNVRLFEEVRARTEELQESLQYQTATSDVLNVISRSPSDIQPVLDAIVDTAARLCRGDFAIIWKLHEGRYHAASIASDTTPELAAYARANPIELSRETLVGRVALERATVHIPDVTRDAKYRWSDGRWAGLLRTMLGVPLLREGGVIGVIAVHRRKSQPFSQREIDLVTTFADQAVIAISNVGLFEQVQARTAELQESLEYQTATSDVLSVISRSPSQIQPVLDTIVETAAHLCDAKRAFIYRYDGSVLRHQASHNASAELIDFVTRNPISPGRHSGVARAAVDKRTIHIWDVRSDPEYTFGAAQVDPIRTVLAVPMLKANDLVGVLVIYRFEVRPFTDKQIELVTTFADQAVIAIENVRLFEEVQARTADLSEALQQQTVTADVLKVISRSTFDLQRVLDTLVETAARLCEADQAMVFRFEHDGYHLAANCGYSDDLKEFLEHHPVTAGRGTAIGRAALEKRTIHIADVLVEPDYTFFEGQRLGGWRTSLAVPLLREGQLIGAFSINRTEPRPFTAKQIELVTTFADQAVIAVENTRLLQEVQARTRELTESLEYQTATSDVLNVISRSPSNIQPVLDAIAETAQRLCRSEHAFIMRLEGRLYRLAAGRSLSDVQVDHLTDNPVPADRGSVTGRVALERRTIQVEDVQADPEYSAGQFGFRTILGVPLLREGAVIGVIVLTRSAVDPFATKQIELLETFADQAVIAIENVRLFDEVQARTRELARSVEELRALGEVSHAVNSTLEIETVLSTIVEKAVQLSATDAGAIYVFSNQRQKFRLRATYGMSEAMIAEIGNQSIGLGESYIGIAAKNGEAVQVADLASEPSSAMRDLVVRAGYRGLLVVPLLRPGRIVGALVVRRKEPGSFSRSTIDLLQTFAAQSVLAIQNARLFADVDARTRELAKSLDELKAAQERLVQTEKLASLGQLTAGIAHEIKNPLNFVNNFAALSIELIDELKGAIGSTAQDGEQTAELMELLAGNLGKVVQHGKRADSIVKNMLLHSRAGSGERRVADINALVEESLNLAYHGARAEKPGFNIMIQRSFDPSAGEVDLLPQEITRVFLNLISNGFYATAKRKEGADLGYEPTLLATTRKLAEAVEIRIRDNGTGMPPDVKEKMFNPFFTTKPAGEGTGLGLSLSHDIVVKQHGGSIEVDTSPGEYTEFRIVLPRSMITPANDKVRQ